MRLGMIMVWMDAKEGAEALKVAPSMSNSDGSRKATGFEREVGLLEAGFPQFRDSWEALSLSRCPGLK